MELSDYQDRPPKTAVTAHAQYVSTAFLLGGMTEAEVLRVLARSVDIAKVFSKNILVNEIWDTELKIINGLKSRYPEFDFDTNSGDLVRFMKGDAA